MDTPISTLITTVLVGILVLMGGVTILTGYATYNPTLDTTGLGNITATSDSSYASMQSATSGIESAMQQKQENAGIFGFLDTYINIAVSMVSALFGSLGFAMNAVFSLTSILGIPIWMFVLVSMFFVIFIGLAVASAIFRIRL